MSATPGKGQVTPDEVLGQEALNRGFLKPEQLREALSEQAREVASGRSKPRSLLNILISKGYLTIEQVTALRDKGEAKQDGQRLVPREEIARGGMGAILRAEDKDIGRNVAMKVMLDPSDQKGLARFIQEARVTGQLEHPGIVPVHAIGRDPQGRPFFTMKLVKGRSLAEVLKGLKEEPGKWEKELGLTRLLNIFTSVCNAIAFAHSKGVVHRDLKPANIMLGDYGEVLVMDWGLAKVGVAKTKTGRWAGEEEASRSADRKLADMVNSLRQETAGSLTMDGALLGTPQYMAPEQARGDIAKIDGRSDIYSLGAILYEILTLKPPVEGKTLHGLLKNVVEGNIQPPEHRAPERQIPRELSAVAMKALAREQEHRYQAVEELRRDIELFLEGRAVSAKPDTAWETFVKLVKRNKGVSAAVAVFSFVLAGGAAYYTVNVNRERAEANRFATEARAAKGQSDVERTRAEKALADFKAEQELRVRQQKTGAGAVLNRALAAVERKNFESALTDADIAVAFDPELPEARLLRAELLIVKKDFRRAQNDLSEYCKLKPDDASGGRLLELCVKALHGDSSEVASGFAEEFVRRKRWTFAEAFTQDRQRLFAIYRGRIAAAWPGREQTLAMYADGKCSLHLGDLDFNDLSPLKGIPISSLTLVHSSISDLSGISGMPLMSLHLGGTKVTNLGPLAGMPLETLNISNTQVSDLSPLRGLPLKSLQANAAPIQDLSPLKGMPLEGLYLNGCRKITDLSPLSAMHLKELALIDSGVTDLSPLKDVKVELLIFSPRRVTKGMEVLREKSGLSISLNLNGSGAMPSSEFWKRYDTGEFK